MRFEHFSFPAHNENTERKDYENFKKLENRAEVFH